MPASSTLPRFHQKISDFSAKNVIFHSSNTVFIPRSPRPILELHLSSDDRLSLDENHRIPKRCEIQFATAPDEPAPPVLKTTAEEVPMQTSLYCPIHPTEKPNRNRQTADCPLC
jgi:hypothetical protein